MDNIDYYEISDKTKGKTGYFELENATILFKNSNTNENEIRTANIEVFGRAIRTSIFDGNGRLEYIFDTLTDGKIDCDVLTHVQDDCYWFLFNDVIILANNDLINTLTEYASSVEDLFESYYLVQYRLEMDEEEFNTDQSFQSESNQNVSIDTMTGIEFEFLCQRLVEKMGFETETTKASGDGGIDIIAYNHQPMLSGKYIIQCKRYAGSVGEPIIRDLYGVATAERANKGILMTTGHFTKSAIEFAKDKQIELIDGEELNRLLASNGMQFQCNTTISNNDCIQEDDCAEQEHYDYYLQLFYNHSDELLFQLTFLEVAASRLYREIWCGDINVIPSIVADFYNVYNIIDIENIKNTNCRLYHSLLFLYTPVLLCERKYDELIKIYYKLLQWDELLETLKNHFELENTYFTVVNNLIQVLLITNRVNEAHEVREKHSIIIDNQLNYYKAQFHCEEEIAQRFKQLAISTMSELHFHCPYNLQAIPLLWLFFQFLLKGQDKSSMKIIIAIYMMTALTEIMASLMRCSSSLMRFLLLKKMESL